MAPVEPPKKAMGRNTALSTMVIAMMALATWSIDLRAASRGDRPSVLMIRSTFSTTTMASSTTIPIASTIAKSVSTLIE